MNEEKIELKKLGEGDIRKILKEIIENPGKFQTESRYILKIEAFHRNSGDFPHYQEFKVLTGEAEIIKISDEWVYDTNYETYIVIPKTIPVIIKVYEYEDLGDTYEENKSLYIFTRNGWVHVPL